MIMSKAEVKAGTATEIGAAIEDARDAERLRAVRMEGAATGALQAGKLVTQLLALLETEHPGEETAKRFLERAQHACQALAQKFGNEELLALGKVAGLEVGMNVALKVRDVEAGKLAVEGEREAAREEARHGSDA